MTQRMTLTTAFIVGLITALGATAVRADIIATWGSTVDDGKLQGVAVNHVSSISDNVQKTSLYYWQDNYVGGPNTILISGGEIIYASAPEGTNQGHIGLHAARDNEQYFQFSFTVGGLPSGHTLDLDTFTYRVRVNASGFGANDRMGWRYSRVLGQVNTTDFSDGSGYTIGPFEDNGGFTGNVITLTQNATTHPLPAGLVNGDVVTFRIYAWGSDNQGSGGNIGHASTRIGGIEITGTQIIPEPASMALLGLGGLMMLNVRRRGRNAVTTTV